MRESLYPTGSSIMRMFRRKHSLCSPLKPSQLFGKLSSVTAKSSVWLAFVSRVVGNSSVALQWFPRKFVTTDFSDCQIVQFRSVLRQTLIPLWILLFEGHHAYLWELLLEKANLLPSLSIAFTKFFISHSLICTGGSSILFGSTRRCDWTLCEPGFNPCLNGHTCLT